MTATAAIETSSGPMAGTDRLNGRVARTLRLGVVASGLLFAAAVLGRAASGGTDLLTRTPPLSASVISAALVHPSDLALALLGAIVLAATPLVRVVLSFEFFASRRDRPFTGLTLFVLAVLLTTIAIGAIR